MIHYYLVQTDPNPWTLDVHHATFLHAVFLLTFLSLTFEELKEEEAKLNYKIL